VGTSYLIDTNALLWLTNRGADVPEQIHEALRPADATVFVSAASAF